MKRTVLGFLLFLIVFLGLVGCAQTTPTAVGLGDVTIEVYDSENTLVAEKDVEFQEGDTLLSILQDNFTVYCADENNSPDDTCSYDSGFGVWLMGLDNVQAFDDAGYIAFYINGEYASTGVSATELVDGNTYTFKYEQATW